MSDDIARQALARSLAARIPSLGHDAQLIVDQLVIRLQILQQEHGDLDVTTLPRFILYFGTEPVDSALYEIALKLSNQRIDRATLHEAARVEMLGEPSVLFDPIDGRPVLREYHGQVLTGSSGPGGPYLLESARGRVTAIGATSIMDADPAAKARALDSMEQECRRLTIESEAEFAPDQLIRVGGPELCEVEIGDIDDDLSDIHAGEGR